MNPEMYAAMYEIEGAHWWFRAKQDIINALLDHYLPKPQSGLGPRLLDAGCGCGLMLQALAKRGEAVGMDFSPDALAYCRRDFSGELRQCDLNRPVSFSQGFDGIVALDVLEHVADDFTAIRSLAGGLNPGGVLLLTVPAHPWMWTEHDRRCMHRRRYTKAALETLCESSGLRINYLSYYNCWLFTPVAAVRLLEKLIPARRRPAFSGELENRVPVAPLNSLLYRIFRSERGPISRSARLPWGVSLIAVLKKEPLL